MRDILNLQDVIGRGAKGEEIEDQVEKIWDDLKMAKHITRQGDCMYFQDK